jgi:DNA-directed RNA polymerase specialized sigma subunit
MQSNSERIKRLRKIKIEITESSARLDKIRTRLAVAELYTEGDNEGITSLSAEVDALALRIKTLVKRQSKLGGRLLWYITSIKIMRTYADGKQKERLALTNACRRLLWERYYMLMTWEDIARGLGTSRSHVARLHRRALRALDETKKYDKHPSCERWKRKKGTEKIKNTPPGCGQAAQEPVPEAVP